MSRRAKNFIRAVDGLAPSWFMRVRWREHVKMRCPHCRRNLAIREQSSAIVAWNDCARCSEAWSARIVSGQPFVDEFEVVGALAPDSQRRARRAEVVTTERSVAQSVAKSDGRKC
jgi:hypothetical protein